jgi:hypothetical protein
MVAGRSMEKGVRSRGVRGHHSPHRGRETAVRVGSEAAPMLRQFCVQAGKPGSRPHHHRLRTDLLDLMKVLSEVDDDSGPDRLARDAAPSPARCDRKVEKLRDGHHHLEIRFVLGSNDAKRDLAKDRFVVGVPEAIRIRFKNISPQVGAEFF